MEITKEKLKLLLEDDSVDRLELTNKQKDRYNNYKNGISKTLAKAEALQEKLDKLLKNNLEN